jgi:1-acyl-sn-glycerol-3-phosphate acyltransferase
MKESPHILDQNHKSKGIAAAIHVQESIKKKDDTSVVVSFFRKTLYNFKCAVIKQYARVTQVLIWFILWPVLNLFFKIEYAGKENLKDIRPPLIIAANHQRFYDAFLLRIGLGFYSKLLPLRFMGTKHFSDPFLRLVKMTGIIHFLYATTGVFTVEKGLGLNKNLKRAKDILKNKGVVGIFPEGTMSKKGELLQFKRGVSALALSANTKVLPVSIKITKGNGLRQLIQIKFLNPYKMHTGETYENLADELRDIIESGLK